MAATAPIEIGGTRVRTKPVMTRREAKQHRVIALLWIAANAYFWFWWLRGGHVGWWPLFVVISLTTFYVSTVLCSAYLFFLGKMRQPVHIDADEARRRGVVERVAVITLTVPGSESIEIVERQLRAMAAIDAPHDNWILVDKVHSPEIEQLAERLGIRYFSRHDVATWGEQRVAFWNQPSAPFQRKTKAGNVNSWLDAYGDRYTHFTQLDIDHVPEPRYLDRVLGYFVDPKVKWVQAPSVYGNHQAGWCARGSTEQEFGLQGPLQMGFFGFSRTPFIIGSHSTYDMAAIREINGFQPTRAEDHLDTVCLSARGYEGVFVPEVIAVGDGPETFEIYLAQQFAWAYSMIQVLLKFTPKLLRRYRPKQLLQFLFVQTWYTFWSLSMLAMFVTPLIALGLNRSIASVSYWAFLQHSLPMAALALVLWLWSRRWHQPAGVGISWRGVVLHVARWVVVLSALVQVLLRIEKPYMITRKGVQAATTQRFPSRVLAPYVGLIVAAIAACWFYSGRYGSGASQGYLFFALQGAGILSGLLLVVLVQEVRGLLATGLSLARSLKVRALPVVLVGAVSVALALTAIGSASRIEATFLPKVAHTIAESAPTTVPTAGGVVPVEAQSPGRPTELAR